MPDQALPGPAAAAELYRDLVLERARRPLLAGAVAGPDATGEGANPLCGDQTRITLRCDSGGRATEIRHATRGCAICAASADLMAERATGLDREGATILAREFERMVSDGADEPGGSSELGPLAVFAELRGYSSRRRCAMLPYSALLAAFGEREIR